MSLLMQALRKAERARSQHGHEPDAEHEPEQAQFGADAIPSPPPMEGGPAFAVMPDAWRLEPLDAEPPVIPAQEAAHDPVPPQARHEPVPPTVPASATTSAATSPTSAAAPSTPAAKPGAGRDSGRPEVRGENHRSGQAPARQPVRMPAAIASSQRRLIILAGTLAAMVAVFAFIYWRAVSGPGPGARLPMVPMPAPGSPQTAQTGMVQGAPIPVTPYVSAPVADPAATAGGSGIPAGASGAGMGVPPAGDSPVGGVPTTAMAGAAAGGTAGGAIGAGSVAALGTADAGAVPIGGGYEVQATTTAAAPASKPDVDVTIPTPEQLAAIPDPAIRAEAMRDAAERAARQVRTEAVPPPSGSAQASPSPTVASAPSTGIVPGSSAPPATERAVSSGSPAAAKLGGTRSPRRTAGQGGTADSPPAMQTAVGEHGEVRFTRGAAAAQIAPGVQNGYAALKSGDLATARQQYDLALLQDPNNRDALLGSAAVALRENDGRQASNNYLRLLELDPNDPEALAGLAEMRPGDLEGNEIRLRGLARKHPGSGPVQFSLGNLYARQGRWPEAQQSYFRAYSAMPDNADYAYNLGVGLDHMNQQRLAQTYYRKALELAQSTQPAFNVDAVRKRLQALETPPQ